MMAWRDEESAREPPPPALVVEVPLLFEAGMEGAFDATVAVVADEEIRAQRAGERGHEVIDEREARQLTQDEKAELADHVVANSGTIEELEQQLSELLEKLRATPMSARPASRPHAPRRAAPRRRPARRKLVRRWLLLLGAVAVAAAVIVLRDGAVSSTRRSTR